MCKSDKLWCVVREMEERMTELETRVSLLEDGEFDDVGDVTLEDWDDDEDDDEDFGPVEWDDDDEEAYQARQEVTDEPES